MSRLARWSVSGSAVALGLGWYAATALAEPKPDELGAASAGAPPVIQAPVSELPPPLDPQPEPSAANPSPAAPGPAPAPASPAAADPVETPAATPSTPAPPVKPVRPRPAFALEMGPAIAGLSRAGLASADRAAMAAFYADRQGEPLWVTPKGRTAAAEALLEEVRRAGDYGLDAAAFDLPSRARLSPDLATEEAMISAAVLQYARAARGGRTDPTSITPFLDRKPRLYEPRSLLDQIATAKTPAAYLRELQPHHPQFERLRRAYLAARDRPSPASFDPRSFDPRDPRRGTRSERQRPAAAEPASARRLLANMEEWRWMPDNLGSFYVWVNVPEYTLRVVSNGRVIHTARVVVGKIDTQTPIFSDEMEQVIFHPFWGVPDSIKLNEVLPSLRGSGSVLARHNLRIQSGGRDIDPRSVDWSRADIRKYHVYQPPGSGNVLGVVKFRFPNKHDVYMHDTPTKSLFSRNVRAESHGCMRVQDPVRLAEVLLAEDKRMASDAVRSLAAPGAQENNQVNLTHRIPVHITYFTAAVGEDGRVETFPDIYGHEERISLALEGKAHLIKPVPQPRSHAEPVASLRDDGYGYRSPSGGYGNAGWGGGFGGWGGGWGGNYGPSGGYSSGGYGGSYVSPGGGSRGSGRRDDWARRAFGGN